MYSQGRSYRNNLLTIRVLPNDVGLSRFGFAVGKSVGGAVVRNRTKRRLREIARAATLVPGIDVVVGAHRASADATFAELRRALLALLESAGVLVAGTGDPK